MTTIFWKFFPFWMFLTFFKFAGGLHYSLIAPFGEKLLPLWMVGILMSACSLGQLVLDVPAGHLLDRFGYRRFLKITTFIFLFAVLFLAFGLTTTTFLLSLLFSIFGWLFYGPGVSAYILSHAPKESAGRFISLRDVFGSIGIVLSSAALPFVLAFAPHFIAIILFLLLLIALAMIFLSPKDHFSVHSEKKISTHHHYIRRHFLHTTLAAIKKLNPASGMLLLLNLSAFTFYGTIWFVVPLVIAHQASSGLLGIGLGMFDFAIVALGFLLGNLADRGNKRTLVFFGLLIFSVSGLLIGFNFSWLFLLLGFLATTGDEMAAISLWSWLHSLDKEHASDGVVSSIINLSEDLGWAFGPITAGFLYTIVGPSWTIAIGAAPIFIVWIVYHFMIRKHGHHFYISEWSFIPRMPHRARHKN